MTEAAALPPAVAAADADPARPPRVPLVDVARGVALVAMAVYHFTWDLGFFGFITLQAGIDPGWRLFAKVIAGSFLVLVGISLVLSTRGGLRPGPYLRRLAAVSLAALAITLATLYATPASFIFFGILHCIALSSVLALPLLRAPLWWLALVAALVAGAPALLASPAFEGPALWWLGLAPQPPLTNDFVPILPWFSAVLAGVILGRIGVSRGWDRALAGWSPGALGRGLGFAGRHSLLVYLVHQPLLFGLLTVAAWLGVPKAVPASTTAEFVQACISTCQGSGAEAGFCRTTCACVGRRVAADAAARMLRDAPATGDEDRIRAAVQACRVASPAPAP